jgi:hypothetical protein
MKAIHAGARPKTTSSMPPRLPYCAAAACSRRLPSLPPPCGPPGTCSGAACI